MSHPRPASFQTPHPADTRPILDAELVAQFDGLVKRFETVCRERDRYRAALDESTRGHRVQSLREAVDFAVAMNRRSLTRRGEPRRAALAFEPTLEMALRAVEGLERALAPAHPNTASDAVLDAEADARGMDD